MDEPQDFKSLQDQIQAALIATTKAASLVSSEDLTFHQSLNPTVGDALIEQNARLLALSSSLLRSAASLSELNVPALQDVDDVDNKWRTIVDVIDTLLEKADTSLDEYTGTIKREPTHANQVRYKYQYQLNSELMNDPKGTTESEEDSFQLSWRSSYSKYIKTSTWLYEQTNQPRFDPLEAPTHFKATCENSSRPESCNL